MAGATVYLADFGTVIAFLCYYWLLKRVSAVTFSLIAFITPIIAILLGVFAYDESFTAISGTGTALILTGVFLIVNRQK